VIDARFRHVNVIARDWRSLAAFYTRVFGEVVTADGRFITRMYVADPEDNILGLQAWPDTRS